MDDREVKVSFPVGGTEVIVTRPTQEQIVVLALSKPPSKDDPKALLRLVKRVTGVMEAVMGSEQWDSVVEDGLICGTLKVSELFDLVQDVITFDWTLGVPQGGVPVEQEHTAPEPKRGPRVVSGG